MISELLLQYGILGVWTATLLWERKDRTKIEAEERGEHLAVMTEVSKNMALVNDNLKDVNQAIIKCKARGC